MLKPTRDSRREIHCRVAYRQISVPLLRTETADSGNRFAVESVNATIQWANSTARGFRNKQNFINAIYFRCGKLDLNPVSSRTRDSEFLSQNNLTEFLLHGIRLPFRCLTHLRSTLHDNHVRVRDPFKTYLSKASCRQDERSLRRGERIVRT